MRIKQNLKFHSYFFIFNSLNLNTLIIYQFKPLNKKTSFNIYICVPSIKLIILIWKPLNYKIFHRLNQLAKYLF